MTRTPRTVLLLAVVALLMAPTSPAPAQTVAGSVSGTVTDAGGAPLEGIEVSLYRDTGGTWEYFTFVNTDASGAYSFTNLADPTYRLLARDWGQVWAYQYWPGGSRLADAADIAVDDTAVTVDVIMEPGGHITGSLLDPDGMPLDNPLVFVFEAGPAQGDVVFLTGAADGTYDLGGLPTGDYVVQLTGSQGLRGFSEYYDDSVNWAGATPVSVVTGQVTSGIDAVLGDPTGLELGIAGTVRDTAGVPVAGVEVSLLREIASGWTFFTSTRSAADGTYEFTDLSTGVHRMRLQDPTGVYAWQFYDRTTDFDAAADIVVTDSVVTVDPVLEGAAHITGTLTDPGGDPLEAALVFAFEAGPAPGTPVVVAGADDGTFDLGGLTPGDYVVQYTGRQGTEAFVGYFDAASEWEDATPVTVGAGETVAGIDGVIGRPPGGVVTGEITDLYGRTFDFASVTALQEIDGTWVEAETTDAGSGVFNDPSYELKLPPGTYRLRFDAGSWLNDQLSTVEFWDDVATIDGAVDVQVALDKTITGVDATLGNHATGAISGVVTGPDGLPAGGVEVYVYNRRLAPQYDQTAVTAGDGTYRIDRLYPEAYFVEFYDPSGALAGEWYDDAADPPTSTRVTVDLGEVSGIDAQLQAAGPGGDGSIAGTVLSDVDGRPLFGVRVAAYDADEQLMAVANTDSSGRYRLRRLPAGDYALRLRGGVTDIVGEWYEDAADFATARLVSVAAGTATENVDAAVTAAGAISGSVTSWTGSSYPLVTVTAFQFDGTAWQRVRGGGTAFGSDYTLRGLAPGTYRIGLSGGSFGGSRETEFYDDASSLETASDVVVVAGETTAGIDAVLGTPPGGGISGTVTDELGQPAAGITVIVHDEFGLTDESTTGVDGTYLVPDLFAGTYFVEFFDPGGSLVGEFFDGAADLETATPIVVDDTVVTGIDAMLAPLLE